MPRLTLPFEGPYDFSTQAWREVIKPEPVVYRLRAWDPLKSEARPITRAGGVDVEGILDIGESGKGKRRLDDFFWATQGKMRSHRAGLEYARTGYHFGRQFPRECLRIEFFYPGSKALAEGLELALLEDYRWRFLDRPPLNGSAGKYRKVDAWLRGLGREPRRNGWLDLSGLLPRRLRSHSR